LAQTGSDPGIRLRGDLPKPSARLLDWCANPPGDRRECGRGANPSGDRRECGRPPTCSELACCGGRRPRVTIVVQTLWPAASSSRYRWLKPWAAASSCRNSRRSTTCSELACCVWRPHRVVIVGFGTLLVSLSWCQLGVRLPPRVAIAGSNRGFSRLGWSADPTLLSLSWYKPWCQPLLVSLSWCQSSG